MPVLGERNTDFAYRFLVTMGEMWGRFLRMLTNFWSLWHLIGFTSKRSLYSRTNSEFVAFSDLAPGRTTNKCMQWVFTTGLALSTAVDVLITGSLFLLLNSSKSGATEKYDNVPLCPFKVSSIIGDWRSLSAVIDSLMWYTFETGSLTWYAIFWSFVIINDM